MLRWENEDERKDFVEFLQKNARQFPDCFDVEYVTESEHGDDEDTWSFTDRSSITYCENPNCTRYEFYDQDGYPVDVEYTEGDRDFYVMNYGQELYGATVDDISDYKMLYGLPVLERENEIEPPQYEVDAVGDIKSYGRDIDDDEIRRRRESVQYFDFANGNGAERGFEPGMW